MGDNTSVWLPTNVTILITTKNRQKKLEKFWYHSHAWHSSAARAMRCFCKLTNQITALTPRDRPRKCGKVLQRQKRKAQQVIVCHIRDLFSFFFTIIDTESEAKHLATQSSRCLIWKHLKKAHIFTVVSSQSWQYPCNRDSRQGHFH